MKSSYKKNTVGDRVADADYIVRDNENCSLELVAERQISFVFWYLG